MYLEGNPGAHSGPSTGPWFGHNEVVMYLIKVEVVEGEPLSHKDDNGAPEAVHTALIQAADARYLRQILWLGTP